MKRFSSALLFLVLWVLFSAFVFGAESGDSSYKARFRWNITAVVNGVDTPVGCVGQPIRLIVQNYNTRKPLDGVEARFYLNGTTYIATATTVNGTATYTPTQAGDYGIVLVQSGYKSVTLRLLVSETCNTAGKPTSTTLFNESSVNVSTTIILATSSTSTTVQTTTTLPAPISTTSSTLKVVTTTPPETTRPVSTTVTRPPLSSTVPQPSCSDGIKNQGETDIDCGGPCRKCKSDGSIESMLLFIVAVLLMVSVYSYLQSIKKTKKRPMQEQSSQYHKHHKHRIK